MDLIWRPYDIPTPETEYRFHPTRKWRFDFAWPANGKIAVESEGGVWTYGRHTRGGGFIKDLEKYNEAQFLGWQVFRFVPRQFQTGEAQAFIARVMGKKA